MKIKCTKTGGFLGKTEICEIDFNELNQDEIDAFYAIKKSDSDTNMQLNDGFTYTIEFVHNTLKEKVTLDESTITKDMAKLIQKIERKLE